MIATWSWFHKLDPAKFQRIGVSRGVPRGQMGFKKYPKLNPGPWFNAVTPDRYLTLYTEEILTPLDTETVVRKLHEMADGKIPTLLCWEGTFDTAWCHRAPISA